MSNYKWRVAAGSMGILVLVVYGVWSGGWLQRFSRETVSCPVPATEDASELRLVTPADSPSSWLRLEDGVVRGSTESPHEAACVANEDTLFVLDVDGCRWDRIPLRDVVVTGQRPDGHQTVRIRAGCSAWPIVWRGDVGLVNVPEMWTEVEVDLAAGRNVQTVVTPVIGGRIALPRRSWPPYAAPLAETVSRTLAAEREGLLVDGWTRDNVTHAW